MICFPGSEKWKVNMRRFYYLILIVWTTFLFQGCGNEETHPGGEEPAGEEFSPIQLSGDGISSIEITRAASDFPNNQQIGVVAARYANPVDWTSYDDIENARAITMDEAGGIFYFNFTPVKYWPFNGDQLVFIAYSPAAGNNGVTLEPNRTELSVQLTANTPDVMVASNNVTAATTPYSKVGKPIVDLGEFQHALSQLTVRVTPGTNMNPEVRLESLIVRTTVTSGTIDLLQNVVDGLTVNPAGTAFEYELVTATTNFANTYVANVILFPGSEANTEIYVKFSDRYFTVDGTYAVTDFENVNDPGNYNITFQQGVNSTLQFTVVGTLVEEPNENIHLQGQLTDWDQRQDLGVTIN